MTPDYFPPGHELREPVASLRAQALAGDALALDLLISLHRMQEFSQMADALAASIRRNIEPKNAGRGNAPPCPHPAWSAQGYDDGAQRCVGCGKQWEWPGVRS